MYISTAGIMPSASFAICKPPPKLRSGRAPVYRRRRLSRQEIPTIAKLLKLQPPL
jgi:hypothetical protein